MVSIPVRKKNINLVKTPVSLKKKTVLIVEDDESNRELLAFHLSEKYFVYTAANGQKALNVLNKISIDAVILDLCLPDIFGIEILKKIKNPINKMHHICVIVMTLIQDAVNCDLCRNEGAQAYFTKSWGTDELFSKLLEELEKGMQVL